MDEFTETSFVCDGDGGKCVIVNAPGVTMTHNYDKNGNLIYTRTSGGHEYTYEYDESGKFVKCNHKWAVEE